MPTINLSLSLRIVNTAQLNEQAQQIEANWGEGGTYKIALHTLVGGLQASLAGGNALSGALGAGANEAAIPAFAQLTKDLPEWLRNTAIQLLSASVGALTSQAGGGDAEIL